MSEQEKIADLQERIKAAKSMGRIGFATAIIGAIFASVNFSLPNLNVLIIVAAILLVIVGMVMDVYFTKQKKQLTADLQGLSFVHSVTNH